MFLEESYAHAPSETFQHSHSFTVLHHAVSHICFQIMRGSFDPSEDINMETMA